MTIHWQYHSDLFSDFHILYAFYIRLRDDTVLTPIKFFVTSSISISIIDKDIV